MRFIKQTKNWRLGVYIQGIKLLLSVNINTLRVNGLPLLNQVAAIAAVSLYGAAGITAIGRCICRQKMATTTAHHYIDAIDI